jgi:hypothetical protein
VVCAGNSPADVVDQHVDPVGQLGHLPCGAEVAAHRQVVGGQEAGLAARRLPAQEVDGGRTPGLVATGDQHVVAGGDQPSGNMDADAASGTGHHRDPPAPAGLGGRLGHGASLLQRAPPAAVTAPR